jgi:hypothetical protein
MQQTIKTRHGRTLIAPTPEEDAAINAGIAADPDTHEVTDAEFARMRRMGEDARAEASRSGHPADVLSGDRPPVAAVEALGGQRWRAAAVLAKN